MAHDAEDVGWYVHLGRLSAATEGATETAGSLRRKINEVEPECVAAASSHEEMQFAAALTSCHGRFFDHFHGQATEIQLIGERLSQIHRTYSAADRHSQNEIADVRPSQEA
jgi:hypothetical protein